MGPLWGGDPGGLGGGATLHARVLFGEAPRCLGAFGEGTLGLLEGGGTPACLGALWGEHPDTWVPLEGGHPRHLGPS